MTYLIGDNPICTKAVNLLSNVLEKEYLLYHKAKAYTVGIDIQGLPFLSSVCSTQVDATKELLFEVAAVMQQFNALPYITRTTFLQAREITINDKELIPLERLESLKPLHLQLLAQLSAITSFEYVKNTHQGLASFLCQLLDRHNVLVRYLSYS